MPEQSNNRTLPSLPRRRHSLSPLLSLFVRSFNPLHAKPSPTSPPLARESQRRKGARREKNEKAIKTQKGNSTIQVGPSLSHPHSLFPFPLRLQTSNFPFHPIPPLPFSLLPFSSLQPPLLTPHTHRILGFAAEEIPSIDKITVAFLFFFEQKTKSQLCDNKHQKEKRKKEKRKRNPTNPGPRLAF